MFIEVALPTPLRRLFDYSIPPEIDPETINVGTRVKAPFGRQTLIGIVVAKKSSSSVPQRQIKAILEALDQETLFPKNLWDLLYWSAEYYHYPLGEVFATALPAALRKGKSAFAKARANRASEMIEGKSLSLNSEQQTAIEKITASLGQFHVFLLQGVTGSGKTEVYLQSLEKILAQGKQALVLVPEIGLTPQTLQRFQSRFSVPIAPYHSNLTEKERLQTWLGCKSVEIKLVIATRSGIFLPFTNLGCIVVDEEHDLSFKQQEGFRYSARDLAIRRAQLECVPIVLGSATPSLESFHNAKTERYTLLKLSERAGKALPPSLQILDMRRVSLQAGMTPLLLTHIKKTLAEQNQVLLFLNRRGYAAVYLCHECGWIASCKRCDAYLTLHHRPLHLHCHHCDSQQSLMKSCKTCASTHLLSIGVGTQQLETGLETLLPDAKLVRIDRDNTRRKGSLDAHLESIHSGEKEILIGTQLLAKGHHFPKVTLVGILNADNGLFSSDFRALERTAQLILQVAGRAGRVEQPGTVLIQTHHPEHALLQSLINENYPVFSERLLTERLNAALPPFTHLALLRAESTKLEAAMQFLEMAKKIAEKNKTKQIEILGPITAPMEKRAGRYRMQLLFRSPQRPALQKLLADLCVKLEAQKTAAKVRWSIDVDPQEMV
jgi:primosomal protein N' (replication factor Y)